MALPAFTYPLLCFTSDGDVFGVKDEAQLTRSNHDHFACGQLTGMWLVDMEGRSWRAASVKSIRRVGLGLFSPRDHLLEYELESGPLLTLQDVKDRAYATIEYNAPYLLDPCSNEFDLEYYLNEVRRAATVAEVYDRLGLYDFS